MCFICFPLADQTPTPTRLIRNCEEVGLFDDLKHVNPFDETFRQAIDDKYKRTVLTTVSSSFEKRINQIDDEDTLHTPNIFPYGNTPTVIVSRFDSEKDSAEVKNEQTETVVNHATASSPNESVVTVETLNSNDICAAVMKRKNSKIDLKVLNSKRILPKLEKDSTLAARRPLRKIYPKSSVTLVAVCSPTSLSPIKEKIKASLLRSRAIAGGDCENEKDRVVTPQSSIPHSLTTIQNMTNTQKSVNKQIKPKTVEAKKTNAFDDEATKDKMIKCERNRAAATRYRNKLKLRYEDIIQQNSQLRVENARLKKELQLLKAEHKKCPLTQNQVIHLVD